MKTRILMVAGLSLSLFGTGCVATHKYVAKTIAPVEQRVSTAEAKNGEQDQKLAANASQIESVDRDLSRTKERLTDTDAKAVAAGTAAAAADDDVTIMTMMIMMTLMTLSRVMMLMMMLMMLLRVARDATQQLTQTDV